jgi:hypothetical protein
MNFANGPRTSMTRVEFELTIPVFERSTTIRALARSLGLAHFGVVGPSFYSDYNVR